MKPTQRIFAWALTLVLWWGAQSSVYACATCFGDPDSALTKGLNWGIGSLLVMILIVLGGVSSFFVFLSRRSSRLSDGGPSDNELTEATGNSH